MADKPPTRAELKRERMREQAEMNLEQKTFQDNRGCVDCLCLCFFLAFLGAMVAATVYSIQNGDPGKLVAPLDADNNFCGEPGQYADYPYLFLTDLDDVDIHAIFSSGVCVKSCPATAEIDTLDCQPNSHVPNCTITSHMRYASRPFVGFCVPSSLDSAPAQFQEAYAAAREQIQASESGAYVVDIYEARLSILISVGTAFLLFVAYSLMMSYCSEPLAYIVVFLTQAGLLAATGYCLWERQQTVLERNAEEAVGPLTTEDMEKYKVLIQQWTAGTVTAGVLSVAFLCALCCLWDDLKRAINVIDASSDFLADTYRLIFTPLLHSIFQVMWLILWVSAFACVLSLNEIHANPNIPQMKTLTWDENVAYLSLFMVFGGMWIMTLFQYCNQFIIMVSAATYYWNNQRGVAEQKPASVCKAWKITYGSHIGSLALGSFIITLIRIIRYTIQLLLETASNQTGDNEQAKTCAKCADWCLSCIENCFDYIDDTAYSYIAVTGDGFCHGAMQGMYLRVKFMAEVAFAQWIAKVFIFIGKIALIIGNVLVFQLVMEHVTGDIEEVESETGPLVAVVVVTYVLVSLFLGMFDDSVDAMLTSVAIDINVNREPIYGPATFDEWQDARTGALGGRLASGGASQVDHGTELV